MVRKFSGRFFNALVLVLVLSLTLPYAAFADTLKDNLNNNAAVVNLGDVAQGATASDTTSVQLTVDCSGKGHAAAGVMGFTVEEASSELTVTPSLSIPTDWPADGSGCGSLDPQQSGTTTVSVTADAALGARDVKVTITSNDPDVNNPVIFHVKWNVVSGNTAPSVSVTGVTEGASYEFGSVLVAGCSVVDAEDGNSTFAATLSAITGTRAASGLGSQTASCSYTDKGGLTRSASATYTIVDTTGPVISGMPANMTIEATSAAGAIAAWTTPTATDAVDGARTVTCESAGGLTSGSTFPLGTTTVTCTATDVNGNRSILTFTVKVQDTIAPAVSIAVSPDAANGQNGWYVSDVTVRINATDAVGVTSTEYSLDGGATWQAYTAAFKVSADGSHTVRARAGDAAGNSGFATPASFKIDQTGPEINCGSADGLWHAADVSIACTASDSTSLLADSADAGFNLTTSVAAGTETANASTGSRTVNDQAGNSATAGPISGNKVDKKAPSISITAPTAQTYLLNQTVAASYSCTDGGSDVASCTGRVASGANIDTSSIGSKTFTVNGTDNVGNAGSASVTYSVAYKVCLLYDPTKSHKAGSVAPLKIQLCDASGVNYSSSSIAVKAVSLVKKDSTASSTVISSGNANPDNNFRYDATLGTTGGYIYNLDTTGLSTGTWALSFTAAGDAQVYTIYFDVK